MWSFQTVFGDCTGLTSVTIPNSVTSIGDNAFRNCSSLTSVFITDMAKWCGISFPSSGNPLSYAQNLFLNGTKVTDLVVPVGVTNIANYAFLGWNGLESVTISDGVTSIGNSSFSGCSRLTSVTIPDSVTTIGADAFGDCASLKSVYITDLAKWCGISFPSSGNPLSYAKNLFLNGTKVTDLVVPVGVTNIANYAFLGWNGLESVTISDGVTSIGDKAFYNCSSLSRVTVPDSVANYGADCFEGCPAYTRSFYRAIFNINSAGSSSVVVTTVVQNVEAPYELTNVAADRSIATMTVNRDCSLDRFVLKNGKVYDCALRIVNPSNAPVKLSLPRGYEYETFRGAKPLTIPALSRNILTITRTTDNTFLVSRRQLETVE